MLRRYDNVLVPEMNMGQLVKVLREKSLIDCISLPKVQGQAFRIGEIHQAIIRQFHSEAAK